MKPYPTQPSETDWHFVQELQAPLWTRHLWEARAARADEVSLADGVSIEANFPDENGVLETAYEDLQDFLHAGDISRKSTFVIETAKSDTQTTEAYQIAISQEKAIVRADDSEGIRRGIFHLEEEMQRRGGPFLPLGNITRTPVIRTRISRCFFGPINRPPKNRDELVGDVNYYPDQYLNRLAHHGVNALWLTIKFSDLCPSRFFPEHGNDSERRLAKLRKTVEQCGRYGIKIYAFCIEPRGFGGVGEYMSPPQTLEKFPELAGTSTNGSTYFCTSSAAGQEYLESCTQHLFSKVPQLGGLIDINLGERPTHCYSNTNSFAENNCPRCSKRPVADVFADTTAALQRGMHRGNPDAEMVSWLYVPYLGNVSDKEAQQIQHQMTEIAAKVPEKVLLQVNFESQGITSQWGRDHLILDYSLAYVGPSHVFEDCAKAAIAAGARVSAKLQVGNSHEVATVPFVPVPGNLYRKYQKMRELGVSSAMQCWFFGNYPSPMTHAAGLLSFDPLPETEDEFLRQLAGIHWGENASVVTRAWQHFRDAYGQFPAVLQFSWFGPVHDSIAWPLHLIPVDETIQPSWLLKPTLSGDRVPECFGPEFTFPETLETCRRMTQEWHKGVQLLESLSSQYQDQPELQQEIGVAVALGLQFQSASNVLQFYAWREELPFLEKPKQLEQLAQMAELVEKEINASGQLANLAAVDSRLGFHSEAEGYKYFPANLHWRIAQLQQVLETDFAFVRQQIQEGKVLFSQYTGTHPEGAVYHAPFNAQAAPDWAKSPMQLCEVNNDEISHCNCTWQATADEKNLSIRIHCQIPDEHVAQADDHVVVTLEPLRLWPTQKFYLWADGRARYDDKKSAQNDDWVVDTQKTTSGWQSTVSIPWKHLRQDVPLTKPIRLNISRVLPGRGVISWQPHQPLPHRLVFAGDNSADYGWMVFEEL